MIGFQARKLQAGAVAVGAGCLVVAVSIFAKGKGSSMHLDEGAAFLTERLRADAVVLSLGDPREEERMGPFSCDLERPYVAGGDGRIAIRMLYDPVHPSPEDWLAAVAAEWEGHGWVVDRSRVREAVPTVIAEQAGFVLGAQVLAEHASLSLFGETPCLRPAVSPEERIEAKAEALLHVVAEIEAAVGPNQRDRVDALMAALLDVYPGTFEEVREIVRSHLPAEANASIDRIASAFLRLRPGGVGDGPADPSGRP